MVTDKKGSTKREAGAEQNGVSQEEGISAIEVLEDDHRQVEAFFEEYDRLDSQAAKESLALKICLALQVHAQVEEEIFYPEARRAISKTELVDEAIVEHASAKQLIAEIEVMEIGDSLRDAKVKVLGEQIKHHVEEEEGELFPEVEATETDLNALGQRMLDRKAELLKDLAQGEEGR